MTEPFTPGRWHTTCCWAWFVAPALLLPLAFVFTVLRVSLLLPVAWSSPDHSLALVLFAAAGTWEVVVHLALLLAFDCGKGSSAECCLLPAQTVACQVPREPSFPRWQTV